MFTSIFRFFRKVTYLVQNQLIWPKNQSKIDLNFLFLTLIILCKFYRVRILLNSRIRRFLVQKTKKHDFQIDSSFFSQSGLFCPNSAILAEESAENRLNLWVFDASNFFTSSIGLNYCGTRESADFQSEKLKTRFLDGFSIFTLFNGQSGGSR